LQGGRALQVVIRPADFLSASQFIAAARDRCRIEVDIRDSLSKLPIDVGFDWTPSRAMPPDGYLFFNHDGHPVVLPHRLGALRTAIEHAVRDALAPTDTVDLGPSKIRRWTARAEEYRAMADACGSEAVRQGFLVLADSCESVANRIARARW
jgi:hypothetical protein